MTVEQIQYDQRDHATKLRKVAKGYPSQTLTDVWNKWADDIEAMTLERYAEYMRYKLTDAASPTSKSNSAE